MIFKKNTNLMNSVTLMARGRSKSLAASPNMPDLRDIAADSSIVMIAFLNSANDIASQSHTDRKEQQAVTRSFVATKGTNSTSILPNRILNPPKVKFNEPLSTAFGDDVIPKPLLDLLRYVSDEGVTVPDIFRRPGNTAEQKKLIRKLTEGRPVDFTDYNFYTLASVIKRFLLCIPGGIFGQDLEEKALLVLQYQDTPSQLHHLHEVIECLPASVQRFITLLFGVWCRVADRHHLHKMTAEAMAKSVTGSIFLNTTADPKLVNDAVKVMQIFIENFSAQLFSEVNMEFFHYVTNLKTNGSDDRTDDMIDAYSSCAESPERAEPRPTINKYEVLQNKQMDRLKQRSDWFLSAISVENSPKPMDKRRKAKPYISRKTIACVPMRVCDELNGSSDNEKDSSEEEMITLDDELNRSY